MLDDNKAQMEMDLIMNEQKDPVSGNTAPIGAKPSEVRDDIDIRVSENEFVVNAQTVRYFGEEFFNELQEAAAQGFERIKEGDELPFRDDELDVDETEDQEVEPEGFAYGGAVKGYAEGDIVVPQPVGGGYGGYGGTGALFGGFQSKTYINPETNQKMIVFFFNGRPMKRIPAGFVEMAATPAEQQAVATQAPRDSNDDNYADEILSEIKKSGGGSYNTKDVKDWDADDYIQYASDSDSMIEKGENPLDMSSSDKTAVGIIFNSLMPGSSFAINALAKGAKEKQAQKVYNQANTILKSVDFIRNEEGKLADRATGDLLDEDQTNLLNAAGIASESSYLSLGVNNKIKELPDDRNIIEKIVGSLGVGKDDTYKQTVTDLYKAQLGQGVLYSGSFDETNPFSMIDPYDDPYGDALTPYETLMDPSKKASAVIQPQKPKGKYDPTATTAAGGFKNNVLSKAEQDAFDNAVDSGDSAAANHYVSVNRLRNKQNSFIDGGMTRAEGAAMGLSSWDMDQAEKFGGSVERATTSEEEGGLGTHAKQKNPLSPAREKSDDDTSEDTAGDKILCDLIYRYGYLDEDIWRLDEAFGDRVALEDPELLEGYHTWAKPMVAWIEKETFLSNLYLKYWCVPFTRRWANHIAHVMEPENYKPDYVGKLMLAVGVPISRAIYKLKGRKLKTV